MRLRGSEKIGPQAWLSAIAALVWLGAASPALAEYFTYQGQLQLQSGSDPVCATMSGDTFDITVYGRDSGPQAIEGYLYGDKIVRVHFSGNSLNQLALTYPGDAKPTPERPRLAEPMPVRDAIAECVAELVDQAPELSPRIADKLIRIITGHQH